ncbi:hypothetical protein ANCCEY_07031, partial [Ancylostoma ceylanicum]
VLTYQDLATTGEVQVRSANRSSGASCRLDLWWSKKSSFAR